MKVTDTLPPEWRAMQSLERLELGGSNLTGRLPTAWSDKTSLRTVDIRGTPLQDPLPASWADMPRLEYLYLWLTAIASDALPAWGRMALRTLNEIEGKSVNPAELAERIGSRHTSYEPPFQPFSSLQHAAGYVMFIFLCAAFDSF